MIKVAVVEDNFTFKKNLLKYFSLLPDVEVSFDANSVEEGLEKFEANHDIDILVLDIGLPKMSGIEGIPYFKKIANQVDITILSSYEDEERILKALCAGACSYISKNSDLEEIYNAIKIVKNGGSYMSPSIAREIVHYFIKGQVKKPAIKLTPRQTEIIEMMIEGKTSKAIAKVLDISNDTVRYHIKAMYKALHASNKTEAIMKYMKG